MQNFKSQGFRKKDIRHCSLDFVCLFTGPGDLCGFFASDGSEIQARVEDFIPILSIKIYYLLSHTLIKFSVFVACGSFILQYANF